MGVFFLYIKKISDSVASGIRLSQIKTIGDLQNGKGI